MTLKFSTDFPIHTAKVRAKIDIHAKLDRSARAELLVSTNGKRWHSFVQVIPDDKIVVHTSFDMRDISKFVEGQDTVYIKCRLYSQAHHAQFLRTHLAYKSVEEGGPAIFFFEASAE